MNKSDMKLHRDDKNLHKSDRNLHRDDRNLHNLCTKLHSVDRLLSNIYSEYRWEGPERILDSLVHSILSQNTSDTNSARAYRNMRTIFPRWELVLNAPTGDLADAIRAGGLANNKSRWIQELLRWVKDTRRKMSLEDLREATPEEMLEQMGHLRGIGVKTVYVTLMFACGRDVFPVDTHIHRIVRRLGLVEWKLSRNQTTEAMRELIAPGRSMSIHVNLIRFGREICSARAPKCAECPLWELCTWSDKKPRKTG